MTLARKAQRMVLWSCVLLFYCRWASVVTASQVVVDVSNPGAIQDRVSIADTPLTEFTFIVPTGGTVADINIQLAIGKLDIFYLDIYLKSPSGTIVNLTGGVAHGANFQDTRLDDSGVGVIGTVGAPPFKGPDHAGGTIYKPQYINHPTDPQSLADFIGESAGGTWTLLVYDLDIGGAGTLYSAGQAAPWGAAAGTKLFVTLPSVVGRQIFYNQSSFDGNNVLATTADDGAIATDKTALLPGGSAGFANYTSYSKGINGVMIDVSNLAGTPTVNDFIFRV